MEIESSAQDCEQTDAKQVKRSVLERMFSYFPASPHSSFVPFQSSTQSGSKDASVSQGAGLLREAEELEPQMLSTAEVKRRMISSGSQCPYCRYRCGSRFSFQIHIGSQHPLHCEDVCVGRLGKAVFYQSTAKLFHCHICFFTSKDYAVVFEHLLARHCFSSRKAVHTDNGKEATNKLDPEIIRKEGREQNRSPHPEIKPDDENTTDHHRQEASNEDSLKRKRSSMSSGEDEDRDMNVSDSIQAANDEQVAAVEQYADHSSAPYYDCKLCKLRCASKSLLLYHVNLKHDVPKPYACKECSETFMLESLLTRHISLHHRQELYQCPYCLFESSLQGLHQHLSHCKPVEGNEEKDVETEEKE